MIVDKNTADYASEYCAYCILGLSFCGLILYVDSIK